MAFGRFTAAAVRTASARAPIVRQSLRTYASEAQSVKPPIALYGVDGTYATALVRLFAILKARIESFKLISGPAD